MESYTYPSLPSSFRIGDQIIFTSSDKFNDTGSGYINRGKGTNANIDGYVNTVQGTTTGFIPKSVNGSPTTHYTASSCLYASRLPIFGGMMTNNDSSGLFMYQINYISSSTSYQIGARLMFL